MITGAGIAAAIIKSSFTNIVALVINYLYVYQIRNLSDARLQSIISNLFKKP